MYIWKQDTLDQISRLPHRIGHGISQILLIK